MPLVGVGVGRSVSVRYRDWSPEIPIRTPTYKLPRGVTRTPCLRRTERPHPRKTGTDTECVSTTSVGDETRSSQTPRVAGGFECGLEWVSTLLVEDGVVTAVLETHPRSHDP